MWLFGPSPLALKKILKTLLRELIVLVNQAGNDVGRSFQKGFRRGGDGKVCLATLLNKALLLKKDSLL
jgi:hypothetical protein